MPRIDPLQLLKCLSVLLTPEGGILSRDEVPRLVNLMTKFSKKLVSKCVYVLILKSTETDLVDMFMAEGGWTLIQTWLQDAVQSGNWDLVREILSLLLITPVDVERLKLNILPKLIKSLSRRDELEGVAKLSTQLVQQWLAIVKGSSNVLPQQVQAQLPPVEIKQPVPVNNIPKEDVTNSQGVVEEKTTDKNAQVNNSDAISTNAFYKPTVRDGKLVIRKLATVEDGLEEVVVSETAEEVTSKQQIKSKEEEKKSEEKEKEKSKSSSSRKSRSSSRSSSKDKDRDKDKKKSSSSSKRSSSSSSSKSKTSSPSSRDKDRKEKDRYRNNESPKSNSSSSSKNSSSKDRRDSKDKDKDKSKQAEKDKDTLAKIKPQTIEKLGRIPKKTNGSTTVPDDKAKESKENKEVKKKSFSIGIRKDSEERPKTVKIFNSKMRSTGLEEEVKPAPPRPVKKPTPSVQLPTIPPKRPSPPREHRDPILPPEKKLKIDKTDIPERPGAIKLIPPKPKPAMLQESDLFMDALTASATAKKEPKKRKRRLSATKDCPSSPSSSPAREQPQTPTSPPQNAAGNSPSLGLKNIAPINFYQDTLSTEESTENAENNDKESALEANEIKTEVDEEKDTPTSPATPTDDNNIEEEPSETKKVKLEGGLKGVLLYAKKKGPKRTISWKADADLVEIRYFELDETERVNVTKNFGDMAKMEMSSEREALQLSRKNVGEDTMESQVMWRLPYIIEQPEPLAVPGHKSLEKDIQFAREKSILQFLYFDKRRLPDSPEEPIPENHQMSDPVHIPLEDPDSQEIDLRNTQWPEPKGSPPQVEPPIPHIFPNIPGPFNPPFNNLPPPQFPGMPPRFVGQGGPIGPAPVVGPGNFIPPNVVMNGNMMGPPNMGPPNDMMNQGPINPNMFPPGPGPDGFGPGPDFPMYGNQNPPNNMNMFPPNNFNNHRPGNRGGGFRRGGGGNNGNWVRMSGPGNWKRGGGHRGGRLCKNIQNHGYCRNRDNCPFVHP